MRQKVEYTLDLLSQVLTLLLPTNIPHHLITRNLILHRLHLPQLPKLPSQHLRPQVRLLLPVTQHRLKQQQHLQLAPRLTRKKPLLLHCLNPQHIMHRKANTKIKLKNKRLHISIMHKLIILKSMNTSLKSMQNNKW